MFGTQGNIGHYNFLIANKLNGIEFLTYLSTDALDEVIKATTGNGSQLELDALEAKRIVEGTEKLPYEYLTYNVDKTRIEGYDISNI